jgi:hypothetical protein
MANNYTTWSELVTFNSKEESDWLKSVLYLDSKDYPEYHQDHLSESQIISNILADKFGIRLWGDNTEYYPGFSVEFADDSSEVVLYAEDWGNLDSATTIMQAFLNKFQPDGYFKIEWADTCSKARPGEFGGGAVFVTAKEIKWMSTNSWLADQKIQFKKSA